MGRYRKILVAFDGSESGLNALIQAFRLANDEKSWITVTTVVPSYEGDLDITFVKDMHAALLRPGEEILSRAKETARQHGALIRTVLEEGTTYSRITALAEAENCGVIVLGKRGTTSLERSLMGSTAARVIGHSLRDVMIVPRNSSISWKKILAPTDGSKCSECSIDRAIDLAASYGGELSVLSVVDIPAEYYAEAPEAVEKLINQARKTVADAKAKAEGKGVKTACFVGEGDAHEVILKTAAAEKAEMIVVGSHGRTGLKRLLMGSVTEKVIGYSKVPVLVVKS